MARLWLAAAILLLCLLGCLAQADVAKDESFVCPFTRFPGTDWPHCRDCFVTRGLR
jgi:hypothetical protein